MAVFLNPIQICQVSRLAWRERRRCFLANPEDGSRGSSAHCECGCLCFFFLAQFSSSSFYLFTFCLGSSFPLFWVPWHSWSLAAMPFLKWLLLPLPASYPSLLSSFLPLHRLLRTAPNNVGGLFPRILTTLPITRTRDRLCSVSLLRRLFMQEIVSNNPF